EKRVEEIYRKIPAIREIDSAVGARAVERARQLLEGDDQARNYLKKELEDLGEQRAALLEAYGYPKDYMEMRYVCPDCRDTGYVNGEKCHCFKRAQMKLLYAQSNIDKIIQRENFSTFSYDCFDNVQIVPAVGKTVAQYMREVADRCRRFVRQFDTE